MLSYITLFHTNFPARTYHMEKIQLHSIYHLIGGLEIDLSHTLWRRSWTTTRLGVSSFRLSCFFQGWEVFLNSKFMVSAISVFLLRVSFWWFRFSLIKKPQIGSRQLNLALKTNKKKTFKTKTHGMATIRVIWYFYVHTTSASVCPPLSFTISKNVSISYNLSLERIFAWALDIELLWAFCAISFFAPQLILSE